MSGIFDLFRKKTVLSPNDLVTDIHSHLLPGIDDGVADLEESVRVLKYLASLGYRKIITTPHIMSDVYPNTREDILRLLPQVQEAAREAGLDISIEAAAEYYLDEAFMDLLSHPGQLLSFGDGYLLFETNMISRPLPLEEAIFLLLSQGFKPVMAHPERLRYIQDGPELLEELAGKGLRYQVNLGSFAGYYRKEAKQIAEGMAKKGLVSFLGSDCHKIQHARMIEKAFMNRKIRYCSGPKLLNTQL